MSTKLNQIYKCEMCGNIVEVLHTGAGTLVCCGQPMKLQNEKIQDPELGEKHVPIIEKTEDKKTFIKIGSVPHPMEEKHFIEWIELENRDKGKICRKNLRPKDKPESKFCAKTNNVKARCYCNLHGLWQNE